MGKQFDIIDPYTRVFMPDGKAYDAGDTVVLSDAQYDTLGVSQQRTFVEDDVTDVDDPIVPIEGAAAVSYDGGDSGLTATTVQAALDEITARVAALEG